VLLQVKPGKIVSGQEADRTNELLQTLADIIDKKVRMTRLSSTSPT
jgi:hypothetical protein